MICNKCNKNKASFFLEQNINGNITKIALCPECAKEYKNINLNPYSTLNLLGGLFQPNSITKQRSTEVKKCTLCASTLADISKNGRVGCAECYKVFHDELTPTVRRIHGNVKHVGRKPLDSQIYETNTESEINKIADLKNQLNEAIAREDYETAAELRDKIRGLTE